METGLAPPRTLSAEQFLRSYRLLILLAWIVPPVFGLTFLLFIRMFTPAEMLGILTTPTQPAFDIVSLVFAFWYFSRFIRPVVDFLEERSAAAHDQVLSRIRRFPLDFWGIFLGYLLLAPASVILSAEYYIGFEATPVDWFRIHLVALIVSIIVGLPIFFRILDLFGRAISGIPLTRPHLTIKTKVFMIGALVPLLIDTTIVQYYWTRTGFFTTETFFVWLILELLAVAGSLLFVSSFGQSLRPLQGVIDNSQSLAATDLSQLAPQSTDELGVLTSDFRGLLEQLRFQGEILEIRNQTLASSKTAGMLEETFIAILGICDTAFGSDISFLVLYDKESDEMVTVASSQAPYKPEGYHRMPMHGTSLAVLAFKAASPISVFDAPNDPRVSPDVVEETGVLSSLAVPLQFGDEIIGSLITCTQKYYRNYSERDTKLIEALAQEAALVVHTLMLHQQQRTAEQRYRELNALAPDPILLLDKKANILEANRAATTLLGIENTDLLGRNIRELVSGETEGECVVTDLTNITAGSSACFQTTLRPYGNNDAGISVEIHACFLSLGGKPVIQAFVRDVTARRRAEEQVRRSEKELSAILHSMQDTYFRTDTRGSITRVSPSVRQLLGYQPEEMFDKRLADFYVGPDDRKKFLAKLQKNDGVVKNYEVALRHRDGSVVWVSTNVQYYRDHEGNIVGVEGTTRDVTEIRRAQDELFQEKERAQVTVASIGDGVVTTDIDGVIEYFNPVAEQLTGITHDKAKGRPLEKVFTILEEVTRIPIANPVERCLEEQRVTNSDIETILVGRGGREYAIEYSVSPIRDRSAKVIGVVLIFRDVTQMRSLARQLSHQATHDSLTGLINRREFEIRLEQALASARKEDRRHALCYMDLDQFKVVNDTCGHIAGDELLKQLATQLRGKVRKSDTLARLGGDEFGVLLQDCDADTAMEIADGLQKAINDFRFSWREHAFEVGVSLGLVPITPHSGDLTDVLSAADSACYVAKDQGRNRVHLYQADDKVLAQRHGEMQWVSRILQGLEQDRFCLYRQRIMSLSKTDNSPEYWEILVRMRDEHGKLVPPMAFIPAAERYHLMPAIDRWVVHQAFSALGKGSGDMRRCSINLSGQSLSDDHFLPFIVDQVHETGVDTEAICFEITETAAIANLLQATRFIAVLRGMGCQFALDDFGSGLSSFAYLKNLHVDLLKIDGSFVQDMVNDPIDYAMVSAINQIGHVMGIRTVAEFVENEAILEKIKELGVDYAQGFGIAEPVPLEEETG